MSGSAPRTPLSGRSTGEPAYQASPIVRGLTGLAIYHRPWRTYVNCYALTRAGSHLLVDAGRQADGGALLVALQSAGIGPNSVTHLLATHGHIDHIGAAAALPQARGYIHQADLAALGPDGREQFACWMDGPEGQLAFGDGPPLVTVHVGGHTAGSIAAYDPVTRALFSGDQPCLFREPLPPKGMVVPAAAMHDKLTGFVRRWARAPRRIGVRLGPLEPYLQSLVLLSRFDAAFLCTGHGPVLAGDIPGLLRLMIDAAA